MLIIWLLRIWFRFRETDWSANWSVAQPSALIADCLFPTKLTDQPTKQPTNQIDGQSKVLAIRSSDSLN